MIWRAFHVKKRFIKKLGQKIYKAERWKGILQCRTWLDMKAPRLRVNSSRRANQELSYHNICSLLIIFRKRGYLHQAGLEMGKVRRKSGSQNTSWEVMQWLKHLSNRKLIRKVMWITTIYYLVRTLFQSICILLVFCTVIYLKNMLTWKVKTQLTSERELSWLQLIIFFFCSKPSCIIIACAVFNYLTYFFRKTVIFCTFLFLTFLLQFLFRHYPHRPLFHLGNQPSNQEMRSGLAPTPPAALWWSRWWWIRLWWWWWWYWWLW